MTQVTVVMPAHDEEAIIQSSLRSLLTETRSAARGALAVIVVANGCTDRTVERAREAVGQEHGVAVLDVPEPSKIGALNVGSDLVTSYPVAFVDADVIVAGQDLVELAARLEGDERALVAAPRMVVLPSSSWWVRQYYRVWALTDYRTTGHIGSGIYMLSRRGRERFGAFPDVIADDLYVQMLFSADERLTPDDLSFSVRAPATLSSLIRRNTRIAAGNRQLAERYPGLAPAGAGAGAASLLRRVRFRPALWLGFGVYAVVYATARLRASAVLRRGSAVAWNRDDTTRISTP